jgi:hypothetical protein
MSSLVAYWNGCEVGDIRTAITIIFCGYELFILRRAGDIRTAITIIFCGYDLYILRGAGHGLQIRAILHKNYFIYPSHRGKIVHPNN